MNHKAFWVYFHDRFIRLPNLPNQQFASYLTNFLDGFHYKVYLTILLMFVTILTDLFNHWFPIGTNPGSISKEVFTLLKKGGGRGWLWRSWLPSY